MKFFRQPLVALLLAAAMIGGGTVFSVRQHMDRECDAVTAAFYDGTVKDGISQKSIAACLQECNRIAGEICHLAEDHSLNTDDLSFAREDMELAFMYSPDAISYMHYCYEQLLEQIDASAAAIKAAGISAEERQLLEDCLRQLDVLQQEMDASAYNDQVRSYLWEQDRFPTNILAEVSGVSMPEFFA